ncbi:MAG: M48 family metallopeptidase [Isosphaeraceae bacterium]|nr:M48 family metallopeptidase [Isosphaeraceae bacterium]
MHRRWIVLGLLTLLLAAPAGANEQEAPTTMGGELEPVAVPEPTPLARRYHETGNWIWAGDQLIAIGVPALLLFSGASARLRQIAHRVGHYWFFEVGVYVALYLAITFLIDLPFLFYQGYVRPHAYGLSNQDLGRWSGNVLKSLGVSMAVGVLFAWVPFALISRAPRRWWLYLTLLMVPFLFGVMLVKPVWVDPLFNHFGSMKDTALERKILDLAGRAGIDGSRVFEVDKSRDTKAVNAYVTGFLGTKRIVLWDTLIAKLDEPGLLFVMGHEMGHYALGHVVRSVLLSSVVILCSLFFVDRAGRWAIARWGAQAHPHPPGTGPNGGTPAAGRFGFDRLADVAAVPLILLLTHVSAVLLAPVVNAYSRHQEFEADRFALELTRTNHSGAKAFVKLQVENLSNPRPGLFYKTFRATHPSIGERIDFCNTYHPWTNGAPLVYGGLFRR